MVKIADHSKQKISIPKSELIFLLIAAGLLAAGVVACFLVNPVLSTMSAEDSRIAVTYAKVLLMATLVIVLFLGWLIAFKKPKLEVTSMLIVLLVGILYIFAITPLSAPDEAHHYHSAYVFSNVILGKENIKKGDYQDFNYEGLQPHQNVASAYVRTAKDMFTPRIDEENVVDVLGPYAVRYPGSYIFPVIGLTIGRVLNMNTFWIYTLGRLTNLLGMVFCVYFAVKRAPKWKLVFLILALLPMNMQQVTGFNYDGVINSCCILFIASMLYSIYEKGRMKWWEYLWIFIPAALCGPVKGVYVLPLLGVLFIPKERFAKTWQKYAILVPILVAVLAFSAIGYFKWPYTATGANPAPLTEVVIGDEVVSQKYTFSMLFSDLPLFFRLIGNSILYMGPKWAAQMFGYKLSGMTLILWRPIIVGFFLLLLVALHSNRIQKESCPLSVGKRIAFLAIFFFIFMSPIILMLPAETFIGASTVMGVQGRYFTAALPVLFIPFYVKPLEIKKDITIPVVLAGVALAAGTVINIVLDTMGRAL